MSIKPFSQWSSRARITAAAGLAYGLGAFVTWCFHREREPGQVLLRLGPFVLLRR
jgi:hypothetical protein